MKPAFIMVVVLMAMTTEIARGKSSLQCDLCCSTLSRGNPLCSKCECRRPPIETTPNGETSGKICEICCRSDIDVGVLSADASSLCSMVRCDCTKYPDSTEPSSDTSRFNCDDCITCSQFNCITTPCIPPDDWSQKCQIKDECLKFFDKE